MASKDCDLIEEELERGGYIPSENLFEESSQKFVSALKKVPVDTSSNVKFVKLDVPSTFAVINVPSIFAQSAVLKMPSAKAKSAVVDVPFTSAQSAALDIPVTSAQSAVLETPSAKPNFAVIDVTITSEVLDVP